jgi:hypothetical protein
LSGGVHHWFKGRTRKKKHNNNNNNNNNKPAPKQLDHLLVRFVLIRPGLVQNFASAFLYSLETLNPAGYVL